MNVIAEGGLIGIITETSNNWSTVRSIIDDESNVSAMVASTSDTCVVTGNLLEMDEGKIGFYELGIRITCCYEGAAIVTSNISAEHHGRLLIGYVSDIKQDSKQSGRSQV